MSLTRAFVTDWATDVAHGAQMAVICLPTARRHAGATFRAGASVISPVTNARLTGICHKTDEADEPVDPHPTETGPSRAAVEPGSDLGDSVAAGALGGEQRRVCGTEEPSAVGLVDEACDPGRDGQRDVASVDQF